MRLLCLLSVLLAGAWPAFASEKAEQLAEAMRLDQVAQILAEEGDIYRREVDETLLDNAGGDFFQAQVQDIYDPTWMRNQMRDAFAAQMSDAQMDQAIVFYKSDLGQTVVSLENSARRAFLTPEIEEMARATYKDALPDSMLFELVTEFIGVNDLVEQNVQGTLSAQYNFFKGMTLGQPGDDAELLAQLLAEQDAKTEDTTEWLYSFLLMAYAPLDEAEMREYIAFSRTKTGQALNTALFDGFDQMFNTISFQLGEAVAQVLNGSDL